MRTYGLVWMAAAGLFLSACEKKQESPASVEAPGSGTKAVETGSAGSGEITVELLEAGDEPRKPLRYKFEEGRKDTMMMEMKMEMELELGGTKAPKVPLPAMQMAMSIHSKEVSPEGNLRYEFKLDSASVADTPGVSPMVVSSVKSELAKMEGLSGWAEVSARGFTQDAEVNVPAGAGQQLQQVINNMRQQIRQMSSPFPEEPVGKGARWVVHMPIDTPALKLTQKATYELESIEGDTCTMKMDIVQTAPPQEMKTPNMPPGASARLESLASTGSGNMLVDLTKPVPRSDMTAEMKMDSAISAQGQKQDMHMEMKMGVKIWPKQ